MQVGRDDRIRRLRPTTMRMVIASTSILSPGHVRVLLGDLGRDLVPHHHRMALRIALGNHGEQLAQA
jgi:hypothetical protein